MQLLKLTSLMLLSTCLTSCSDHSIEVTTDINKETCIGLHKVTDVDDLIKQMYDNIDSYCLFEMPPEELEEIWGIKIFEFSPELGNKNTEARWQYHKESDGLYLLLNRDDDTQESIRVFRTELFMNRNTRIWGDADLSRGELTTLPPYDLKLPFEEEPDMYTITEGAMEGVPNSEFEFFTYYIWFNSQKSPNKSFLVLTSYTEKVPGITLYKDASYAPYRKLYFNTEL